MSYVNTVNDDICVHYYNDMTITARVGDYVLGTLLDSGCNRSNMNWELVKKLKLTNEVRPPEITNFKMASGDI